METGIEKGREREKEREKGIRKRGRKGEGLERKEERALREHQKEIYELIRR